MFTIVIITTRRDNYVKGKSSLCKFDLETDDIMTNTGILSLHGIVRKIYQPYRYSFAE